MNIDKDYNAYNTDGSYYHRKDNDFIMFPSHIEHWVDENNLLMSK